MEVIIALPFILIPLFFPLIAGWMALNFGRRFWPWFLIGLILPFVANIILLCLPDKRTTARNHSFKANEGHLDPLPTDQKITQKNEQHEVYFSASA